MERELECRSDIGGASVRSFSRVSRASFSPARSDCAENSRLCSPPLTCSSGSLCVPCECTSVVHCCDTLELSLAPLWTTPRRSTEAQRSTGMPDSESADPRIADDADTPYALVPAFKSVAAAYAEPTESTRALVAPLAQSIARSQISSAPTLLPAHLAQLVTALSLAARVSLRASALFIEAIVETLQRGTATGLGVTRRALIAAVGSARALHYVTQGLDWSGRGDDGKKIE